MARILLLCAALLMALSGSLAVVGCQRSTASAPAPVAASTVVPQEPAVASTVTTVTPTTEARSQAEAILQGMTLRQKAAQILLLQFTGMNEVSPELRALLVETPPAGLMLFTKNVKNAAQLTSLNARLQEAAGQGLEGVKLFIAADEEGGDVQRVRDAVPAVPAARTVGESWTPEEAALVAGQVAKGLLAQGVNMNLSPVADVIADPGFLYTRTFGGDADTVAAFVGAITEAYERQGLITVLKHFPGHGSAPGDSHVEAVASSADRQEFETVHLVPFEAGLRAGADGVIVGHLLVRAYDAEHPASSSPAVIGGLLRDQLGFRGLVVSDSLEMTAARMTSGSRGSTTAEQAGEVAVACLKAGCDLLLSTGPFDHELMLIDAIVAAVESGEVPATRLDDAVLHVLELKADHGLLVP